MSENSKLMGVQQYANHRGVSRKAVQRAIADGRIPYTINPDNNRKQIDCDEADQSWARNTDQGKMPHAALVSRLPDSFQGDMPGDGSQASSLVDLFEAKAAHEKYKAELTRLKLEREKRLLIPVGEIQKAVETEYSYVRTRLLAIPSKTALQISNMTDPAEIKALLDNVIAEALAELVSDKEYAR